MTLGKWTKRILLGVVAFLTTLATYAGSWPVFVEPDIPDELSGAGVRSVLPSYSGLEREFPDVETVDMTEAALGEHLFFDPILSGQNNMSCATCHHPDKGFSDSFPKAITASGDELTRNSPTLWNVAYNQTFFHDGRADSLELQAHTALLESTEMDIDPDQLAAKLSRIDEYVEQFDTIYGEDSVTIENVESALAAFQRTLISNDSPFDRYAAGDFDALTPSQRRGLALFRSGATRCFECHANPTFASDTFRVVGIVSDDPGRAGVADNGAEGAFRVPTLRNIALTAPYMHNGSMATLEEVVEFYADGGGRQHGREDIDPFVQGFELSDQEKEDLVAFMHALTDESTRPEVPDVALSGLDTVTALTSTAARARVAFYNTGDEGFQSEARGRRTMTVRAPDSIQDVVDRARPGDTILIPYGVYHERVVVDVSDITLQGIPNEDGDYPVLDGRNELPEAVIGSGNNFELAYLEARNFTDTGFLVEGVTGLHMHHLTTRNTGAYGIYPVRSTDILIENVKASRVNDAAIYAGQSENIVVRDCEAFDSVIGVEIENSINGDIYDCHIHGNSLGILYVVLPNLDSKVSREGQVIGNLVENNNRVNDGPPGTTVSEVPPGTGLLLFGSDDILVYNNTFKGNKTTGTAVFSLLTMFSLDELDVTPLAENNQFINNTYEDNGYNPDPFVRGLGIPTGDILWDGTGWGNNFDEPDAIGGFPPIKTNSYLPEWINKIYFRSLQVLLRLVG